MELERCLKKRGKKQNLKTIFQKEQNSKNDDGETINFIHFLDQIKERQNNIDMKLFKSYFTYETPHEMV